MIFSLNRSVSKSETGKENEFEKESEKFDNKYWVKGKFERSFLSSALSLILLPLSSTKDDNKMNAGRHTCEIRPQKREKSWKSENFAHQKNHIKNYWNLRWKIAKLVICQYGSEGKKFPSLWPGKNAAFSSPQPLCPLSLTAMWGGREGRRGEVTIEEMHGSTLNRQIFWDTNTRRSHQFTKVYRKKNQENFHITEENSKGKSSEETTNWETQRFPYER